MKTVQEQIQAQKTKFQALSASRRAKLAREARLLVTQKPWAADNSTFWRGLSARQILEMKP